MIITKHHIAHRAALLLCKVECDCQNEDWIDHILFREWLLQYGGVLGAQTGGWEIGFENEEDALAFILKFS